MTGESVVRSVSTRLALAVCALCGWLVPAACGGAPQAGMTQVCDDAGRVVLDCTSEVAYQGVNADGSVSVLGVSAGAAFEEVAIRAINDELGRYVAVQTRLCREYNACILSREQYIAEARATREAFERVARAGTDLTAATSSAERRAVLGAVYQEVAPTEAQRTFDLQFVMRARLAGGATFVVPAGAPLPTGASVSFELSASQAAYVYLFQQAPDGSVAVLFPSPRIAVQNPLGAGSWARIPSGDAEFRLNDRDLGAERVYVVATLRPHEALERAVARTAAGEVTRPADDPALASLAKVQPGADCKARALELLPAPGSCPRTRGLVLDAAGPAEGARVSLAVRTDPGDDTIVKVFPFEHLTAESYEAARRSYAEGTSAGARTRGGVVED